MSWTAFHNINLCARSAFHASPQAKVDKPPAVHDLLPLVYEKSASLAMIKRGMEVANVAKNFLNPDQIPITISFDQPIFAIVKFVQWKWSTTRGEKVLVARLGDLRKKITIGNTVEYIFGWFWLDNSSHKIKSSIGNCW